MVAFTPREGEGVEENPSTHSTPTPSPVPFSTPIACRATPSPLCATMVGAMLAFLTCASAPGSPEAAFTLDDIRRARAQTTDLIDSHSHDEHTVQLETREPNGSVDKTLTLKRLRGGEFVDASDHATLNKKAAHDDHNHDHDHHDAPVEIDELTVDLDDSMSASDDIAATNHRADHLPPL